MSRILGKFTIAFTVFLFVIFLGGPLVWLVSMSLKSPIEILAYEPKLLPNEIQLGNYQEALEKSGIIHAFINSVVISTVSTLVICLLVVVPAYVFARSKGILTKGMSLWILISQVFPLSLLIIPMFLSMQRLNLINSQFGLILIYVIINIPFSLWLLRSFVLNIPKELEEAARIDGATTAYMIRTVILPLLLPGMVVVAIFTFVNVWNEFFFALVFLSDPEKATLPLKLAQFLGSEGRGRFGALAAATVMAIIPALVMFGIIQRKFSDNFLAGAVKG
jgi:multiple sugar transport system permease protein